MGPLLALQLQVHRKKSWEDTRGCGSDGGTQVDAVVSCKLFTQHLDCALLCQHLFSSGEVHLLDPEQQILRFRAQKRAHSDIRASGWSHVNRICVREFRGVRRDESVGGAAQARRQVVHACRNIVFICLGWWLTPVRTQRFSLSHVTNGARSRSTMCLSLERMLAHGVQGRACSRERG
jgi:hypothetical protein